MVVLLEGSPISTEELWSTVSDHWVLGHLPDQGRSPQNAQFGRVASSRVLVVPNFLHLRMMEATVFLGTFNSVDSIWYPSPDLCLDTSLSRGSMDNPFNLIAWFLLWYALSTVGPYIERCGNFQIMTNQLNLPQVDGLQSSIFLFQLYLTRLASWEHLKNDQWKQDAPELNFESHSKGSEYLCKCNISIWHFL